MSKITAFINGTVLTPIREIDDGVILIKDKQLFILKNIFTKITLSTEKGGRVKN